MTRIQGHSEWHDVRVGIFLAGGIAVLYLARDTFIPLAFAIILAMALSPAVASLQKLHIGRLPAAMAMVLLSVAVAGGVGYVIFNQLVDVVNDLPAYRETIHTKVEALRAPHSGALGRAAQSVTDLNKELATSAQPDATPVARGRRSAPAVGPTAVRVLDEPASPVDYVRRLVAPLVSPMATTGIVLVFAIFLLAEASDLRNRVIRLAGLSRLNQMTQALDDASRRLSRYLLLQFLVNAGFGVVCSAGLYLIGVPYAALWGVVAALLRVVPYAGSVVAALLPFLLALAVFDGWTKPFGVLLMFLVLELATGNFLEPVLYGAHTGISSLALLLTTVFWTTLWGPAGLILSTPLTVCVVVLGRHVPHLSFLQILLGDQPVLEQDAQLYQRLLALDDFEARALVAGFREGHSLLETYDSMIIPVLAMAEQDRHKGALDPEREEFLFLNLRDILASFGEFGEALDQVPAPVAARIYPGRVLCFPANDEADEIAAAMMSQILGQSGRATLLFPLGSSMEHMLNVVAPTADDILFISTIPPLAFTHARALSLLLRSQFPEPRMVIGLLGYSQDIEQASRRFRPPSSCQLVSSLAGALECFCEADAVNGPDTQKRAPATTSGRRRTSLPSLEAKAPEHVDDQSDQQNCAESNAGSAATTPAAMAVVAATSAKNQ